MSATLLTVFAVGILDLAFARTIYLYSDKSKQAYYYAYIAVFAGLWSFATGSVNLNQEDPSLYRTALICHYILGTMLMFAFIFLESIL